MLDIVIDSRKAAIAPGMEVRRILPFRLRRMVGPFIFMDHAGPVNVAPGTASNMDVLPHPHIGLSTVSYLFAGQVALNAVSKFGLPKGYTERDIYVANGSVELNGIIYTDGKMLVFSKGVDPVIIGKENSTLMLMGGEPLGERHIWWNFVSSRKER